MPRPQEVRDKFMRLQADFDNFRKRTTAEKDSLRSQVKGDTVAELLPLVSPPPAAGPGQGALTTAVAVSAARACSMLPDWARQALQLHEGRGAVHLCSEGCAASPAFLASFSAPRLP